MNRHLLRCFAAAALAASGLHVATPSLAEGTRGASLTLSRSQAEMFDRAMPGRVIWVDVACCTPASILDAVATAEILRIAGAMTHAAPVFVTGRDARHAARAAERIMNSGMPLVFLVADDTVAASGDALESP